MVVWKVLQYGHSRSMYSIILTSALGLPMMWSTPGVYGRTVAVLPLSPGVAFCMPAKNTPPAIKAPATTMVIGSTYWLFIWGLVYQFLKRKGMGERRGVSGQLPLAGVELYLADAVVVAVFDRAVLAGVLVQIFGNGDIGQAVVADLLAQALLPPLYGLQPVAGFVAAERGAGKVVEFEPAAQNIFNFFQQVDAFYFREVARVILAEYRDIDRKSVV